MVSSAITGEDFKLISSCIVFLYCKESVIPDKLSLRALIFIITKWTETVVKFKFMLDVHLPDLNDFQ